jgi:hypothetical protein
MDNGLYVQRIESTARKQAAKLPLIQSLIVFLYYCSRCNSASYEILQGFNSPHLHQFILAMPRAGCRGHHPLTQIANGWVHRVFANSWVQSPEHAALGFEIHNVIDEPRRPASALEFGSALSS